MEIKLVSGALGAEVRGIDLKDSSLENWKKINNLLLEHKALFFRDQDITSEEQINLAKHFGPLERHIYVKGRKDYPEILRIIKAPEEKRQWGETWHTDVSYNPKPTKVIILRSIKVPPVGGDTMFSNMEIAYDTLSDKIKDSDSWRKCQEIAYRLTNEGKHRGITEGATHYHATYVKPIWRKDVGMTLVGRIGSHIFYRWN